MKERIQVKHDIAENWAKAVNFIPLPGEIIIYDGLIEDGKYVEQPRLKIGDGIHTVNELPFFETAKPKYKYKDGQLELD